MQTLILCNTVGDRVSPLCQPDELALVPMPHKPLIEIVTQKLREAGLDKIAAVTPARSGKYLPLAEKLGIKLVSGDNHTPLAMARRMWEGEDMLLVDLGCFNLPDFAAMIKSFKENPARPQIMLSAGKVKDLADKLPLRIDEKTLEATPLFGGDNCNCPTDFAFSGVYILSRELFFSLSFSEEITLMSLAKRLAPQKLICAYPHKSPFFVLSSARDVKDCISKIIDGKMGLSLADMEVASGIYCAEGSLPRQVTFVPPVFIGKGVKIGAKTVIGAHSVLCENVSVGERCNIADSLLLPDASCKDGVFLCGATLAHGAAMLKGSSGERGSVIGETSTVGSHSGVQSHAAIPGGRNIPAGVTVGGDCGQSDLLSLTLDDDGAFSDANHNLTPEKAASIAMAVSSCLQSSQIVCVGTVNGSEAETALKNALLSGFCASGIGCFDMGECTAAELGFASVETNAALTLHVSAQFGIFITLRHGGVIPLCSLLEGRIEAALERGRKKTLSPCFYAPCVDGITLKELYLMRLESSLENNFHSISVSFNSPLPRERRLGERIFARRNDSEGEQIIFHPDSANGKLTAYSEETGYVFWERLTLIAAAERLSHDEEIFLPEAFPPAAETLAEKLGGKIFRYAEKLRTDENVSRILKDRLYFCDPLFLACRVADILSRNRTSLAAAQKSVPDAYSTRRFVALSCTAEEINKAVGGDYAHKNDSRAFVRRVKNGGVMIYAGAGDSETATSVCDELERALKSHIKP